jgi:FkbM family methyltransferase
VIETNIPNSAPIKLVAYYDEFIWYYPNCEMQTKRWFVENAKPDWIFLDVGANIGYYSMLFSRLAPEGKVYAFEPTSTFDMLLQNLDFNHASNVIPYKMAVGKSTGIKTDKFFRIWGQEAETLECPFTTIDQFVEENNITKIDAIKIDVDSYDFEVLQGAINTIKRFNPFVMVEINNKTLNKRGISTREVYEWLYKKNGGYRTTCIFDEENHLFKHNIQDPDANDISYPNVWHLSNLMKEPYLSIVTVSRNDEHGGDPLRRTQIFIDSYAWQAEHYKLETELILIDWNPPKEKPGLADALNFPANEYFYARVITVPPEVHEGFRYSEDLPLFQFIGKNAGIRRARGEFILATCMDSVLDDGLFEYLARKKLNKNWVYRVDLYDVKNTIFDTGHAEQQAFCRNPECEDMTRGKPQKYRGLYKEDRIAVKDAFRCRKDFPWLEFIDDEGVIIGKSTTANMDNINSNACGDFTLMHREAWNELRGHGEFESYSMHIDSQLLAHAIFYGFTEVNFIPPFVGYHIAHGFQRKPESSFITITEHLEKMTKSNVPVFSWNIYGKDGIAPMEIVINLLRQNPRALLNNESWGLRDINLEENIFDKEGRKLLESKPVPINFKPLSAIKPEFYFEKIAFESFHDIINEKILGKAYRVAEIVEIFSQHRIIWFFIRGTYKVSAKLYKILRAIKRKLL